MVERSRSLVCASCDLPFMTKTMGRPPKFCSVKCRRAAEAARVARYYAARRVAWDKTCPTCTRTFTTTKSFKKFCSAECRLGEVKDYETECKYCHQVGFRYRRSTCPDCAASHLRARRTADNHLRRRLFVAGEQFDPLEIFDRDGWVCQICDESVDPAMKFPSPDSASLDHVTPISLGGDHTRSNARLAHLGCNMRRGNRVEPTEAPRAEAASWQSREAQAS